jgi:hypothetical protein
MLIRASSANVIPLGEPKRRFVRLDYGLLHSQGWQLLHPVPRALYVELAKKFNGYNNGKIGFSVRDAASALHISPKTACRAFHALEMLGFIICTKRGSLNTRQSSEWRLPASD